MLKTLATATMILGLGLSAAFAAPDTPQPVQQHNSNALWFENWTGLSNAQMTINHPDGTIEQIDAKSGTPVFKLTSSKAIDGVYHYEVRAATEQTEKIKNPIDNGRGKAQRDDRAVPFYISGRFIVSRGVIVTPEDIKEE